MEGRKVEYCIGAVDVFEVDPNQEIDFDTLWEVGDQRLVR
jgi:hypothetical protein